MTDNTPTRRRNWAPDADSELAAALRVLANKPWLVAGRDDAVIGAIRRNREAAQEIVARLGWVLIVERDFVRLRKTPPARINAFATGIDPVVYSWFFLLVAAAESMPPKTGIGTLIAAARSAAAEAGVTETGTISERRAITAALKALDERGVVELVDGDVDAYVRDEQAGVLVHVHHDRLPYVIANFPALNPAIDPDRWLAAATADTDVNRRMRRRLIDDTIVYRCDLDDAETNWLTRRFRDEGEPVAAAFGLETERRSEGAAFVIDDDSYRWPNELGPIAFPASGSVADAALLLCDHIRRSPPAVDGAPGPNWRTAERAAVVAALAEVAATDVANGWSGELRSDPDALADAVHDMLAGLDLVRVTTLTHDDAAIGVSATDDAAIGDLASTTHWWFAPSVSRWPETPPPRVSRRAAAEHQLTLLEQEPST